MDVLWTYKSEAAATPTVAVVHRTMDGDVAVQDCGMRRNANDILDDVMVMELG